MRDGLKSVIDAAESEIGPHPDLTAFLTVRDAVRESEGSDAARAYSDGAQVTLYSDEGHEYRISFASLMDELLMLAALDTGARLRDRERERTRLGRFVQMSLRRATGGLGLTIRGRHRG